MDKTEKSTVQLIIDGERAKVSLKELGTALKVTRNEFRLMKEADDPKAYAEKEAALKKLNEEYRASKNRLNEIKKASFELKDVWNQVFKANLGASAIEQGLNLLGQGITRVKDKVYDLSDSLSDVQKASGLTNSEIRKLNGELSKIDTRTLNKDLRDIAQIGGKNGIMDVNALAGFTKSTDMINVSLGDQFDNVTELSESLINMRTIFSDIKSDDIGVDVLHIGNALNYLDAQGTASGKGMVDFASRMGGTLIPLGLTSGQILGLSATMEELSITAERGSTAVNTVFQKMLTNVDGFAKVAGMKSKDFAHLLNTDIFTAFNAFVSGAKNSGAQATEFAKILEDTELSGSGASEVVLKLASNQLKLSTHVDEATKSLKESNTITDEFNKKNNNAAAVFDKWDKKFDGWIEKFALLGITAVEAYGKAFGMIDAVAARLGELKEEQDKIIKNESQLGPLVKRYDELRQKAKLSADEQKELNKIMSQIVGIVPDAATGFDAYGNAIDISKSKVQQFISEQHEMLKVLRQTKIELLSDEFTKKQKAASELQKTLNQGYKEELVDTAAGGVIYKEKLTPEMVTKMQAELADLRSQIAGNRSDALSNRRKNRGYGFDQAPAPAAVEEPATTGTGGKILSKKEIAEAKRLANEKKSAQNAIDTENRKHASEQTKLINLRAAQGEYEKKVNDAAEKERDKELEKQREFAAAEDKYDREQAEKQAKANFDLTTNTIGMAAANGDIKPQDANQAKLDAEEAYQAQLILIKKSYGQDTSELEQSFMEASINRLADQKEYEKRNAEERKQAEYDLQNAKSEALEAGIGALKSFFKESSAVYKALFVVEKAAAIANIIIKNQQETAGIALAYAAIPGGAAISAPLIAASRIRAAIGIGLVAAQTVQSFIPGREEGGYTDLSSLRTSSGPAGYVSQPTLFQQGARSFIAGEKYKQEYVIPFDMLQDPAIRAVTENIEAMRISGKRPGQTGSGSGGGSGSSISMEAVMLSNTEELKGLRKDLQAGKIGVVFNHKEFQKFNSWIEQIYSETSL